MHAWRRFFVLRSTIRKCWNFSFVGADFIKSWSSLLSLYSEKNTLQKPQTLLLLGYLRSVFLRTLDRWRAGASRTNVVRELCSRCTTIWFWGAFTRLPTSTTTTSPNSLQRLRCYDDDMADPSSSSTAADGYLSLSLLLIYLFFFLPVLQYA
jgi:hypothetical protein